MRSRIKPEAATAATRSRKAGHVAAEYARVVELVHNIREGGEDLSERKARHWSLPAGRISADFFCAAEHDRNGWFCLLADAAGHGLAPAVFSLHTPMLFRESVLLGMSLPAIFERIDRFLIRQCIPGYFVCGVLVRICNRDIEIVSAGMPNALLLNAVSGELLRQFVSDNLPFGIAKTADAQVDTQRYRVPLDERAKLILYSDGLSELGYGTDARQSVENLLTVVDDAEGNLFDRLAAEAHRQRHLAHDDISIVQIPIPLPPVETDETRAAAAPDVVDDSALSAMRCIIENLDQGLVLTDAQQRILYVNPAFAQVTGYSQAEAIGQTPRILHSGRQDAGFYRTMWQALLTDGSWSGEIWNRRKDGGMYMEWLQVRALRDEGGRIAHFLGAFTVLSERSRCDERMQFLALHDPLTGLANRVLLADRAEHAMRRVDRTRRSLAVLFIDIDDFKAINDSLGHDIGDEVLNEVGRRLKSALRDDDTLSHYGSDEFICLLPDIACREDAALVADKLLRTLEQTTDAGGHRLKVAASIGISVYPSDGPTFDNLVVFAERAAHKAKQSGGNMIRFFDSQMAVTTARQLELTARLDAGIRDGELELHFQPKIDFVRGKVVGAEALVRWRDPLSGLVPPGTFIPIAERCDLIARIGNWVLHEACAALARWDGIAPTDFHVAVNVSPIQFERSDLAAEVATALSGAAIPGDRLQIEVTESAFIRDIDRVSQSLKQMIDLGVSVALDDFGTGYSNLASLGDLPLDTFKLDQCFVRGIDQCAKKHTIAKTVRHLADGLGKKVVAEGVENCDECRFLQNLGYTLAQGYAFGRPMAEAEFLAHLRTWKLPSECLD